MEGLHEVFPFILLSLSAPSSRLQVSQSPASMNMEITQDSLNTSMPETESILSHQASTQLLVVKPPTWRLSSLSSLESILEYKEGTDQEKRALATIITLQTCLETSSSEEASTNVSTRRRFRCTAAEVAFCFSMALTQLLAVCQARRKRAHSC